MDKHQAHLQLQAHLRQLSTQFAQRLQAELPPLAAQARQLLQASDGESQLLLGQLRDQLHKLAGSAGTFGFADLGQRARALEQQAQHWLDSLQQRQQGLQDFIQQLQQLAEQPHQAQVEAAPAQKSRRKAAKHSPEVEARVIYILEDDLGIGENIRLTLNTFGYQAAHFSNIAELDAAIALQLPDALIVDVNLPNESQTGLDYATALNHNLESALPLLVLTTQNDFATQLQAARAGAMGFFGKPLDIAKLENRLERCFTQQHGEPYRVLIVDDDRDLSSRYSLVLRSANMRVDVLNDPAQILDAMASFNPEVLLLDINMPNYAGPELAQIIRFNDDWLRVPIIYLSAETDIARQMNALIKAGDDFIAKPISDNRLITTVFARAQRARLLSQALARDSLTGLLKHADIKEQVLLEQERALRSGKPVSVVMLDIDHFKRVNDTHGHGVGDTVIRALANLLRQRLRRIDSLGRYGGEEFLAVLPDCSAEQALRILDEIRQQFSAIRFSAAGCEFSVSLSAGIASSNGSAASELMEQADRALYTAKQGGRNQVRQTE
ncbi:diguanylate cyclase [Pseudomonas sp.]|uniref:diguanylate cyclase n=1 Tax=Pseudomonas sp. TaxID=306 RepID=UPI002733C13B|nr:diguanylate cyclase [Pseudomonas sp.]MDP3815593.1 diguanylate cyclase [Pseudomonas sp.]